MPSELARIYARILDGLRPAEGQPRGRPLQRFLAAEETVRLQEPLGGTAEQERFTWGGATAKWGASASATKWMQDVAITVSHRASGAWTWNGSGSRWGVAKWS